MSDALDRALLRLPDPLRVLGRRILAAESRVDAVASDPEGAAVLVLRAAPGEDRAALVDLLAHARWLAPRLADWRALAPELPLAPDARVRGLLLAPAFDPRTRAAAATLGPVRVMLGRWHAPPPEAGGDPWIELLEPPDRHPALPRPVRWPDGAWPPEPAAPAGPQAADGFRTGLTERDLVPSLGGRR